MREAFKMQLELLGHKGLWQTGLARTIHDTIVEFEGQYPPE